MSVHISNLTQLAIAAVNNSITANEAVQMIQRDTVNGVLPFGIQTGLGTMVSPLLLYVDSRECDSNRECDGIGLRSGAAAGLGIGVLIVGLLFGIAGTLLVLLVIRLSCRSKSSNDGPVTYEKQKDEVIAS